MSATRRGKFIVAANGAGKSWLAEKYPSRFADTDEIMAREFGDFTNTVFLSVVNDPSKLRRFQEAVEAELAAGKTVLSNMTGSTLDQVEHEVVGYHPSEYVAHMVRTGRKQLIEDFGELEMTFRARRMKDEATILLHEGQFLKDVEQKLVA